MSEFSELFDIWLDLVDEVFRKQLFFYPLYLFIFSMVYLEDNPRQVFFTIRAGFRLVDLY